MKERTRLIIIIIGIILVWKTFEYYDLSPRSLNSIKPEHTQESGLTNLQNVKVTLYYESLCSDSRNFIIKHMLPTYSVLSQYMTLDLVPYGKAKTIETQDGKIQFHCQHAETECLGNKIHACTIDQISDPMLQLKMVACMIDDGLIPYDAAERCARSEGVDHDALLECTNDIRSSLLLKAFGERTNNVQPSITFIPTIELNGAQKVPLPRLLKDFKSEICKLFTPIPEECS